MKVCECELSEFTPDEAPICGEFDPVPETDSPDCCEHCRHGERCHREE